MWTDLTNIQQIYIIGITCAVIIILYGIYRCKNPTFEDPLNVRLNTEYKFVSNIFNGWALSHFIFYMILGYMYSDNYIALFIMGVIWELYEMFLQSEQPWYVDLIGNCNVGTDQKTTPWWYGQYEDIIVNGIGIMVGVYLAS